MCGGDGILENRAVQELLQFYLLADDEPIGVWLRISDAKITRPAVSLLAGRVGGPSSSILF